MSCRAAGVIILACRALFEGLAVMNCVCVLYMWWSSKDMGWRGVCGYMDRDNGWADGLSRHMWKASVSVWLDLC